MSVTETFDQWVKRMRTPVASVNDKPSEMGVPSGAGFTTRYNSTGRTFTPPTLSTGSTVKTWTAPSLSTDPVKSLYSNLNTRTNGVSNLLSTLGNTRTSVGTGTTTSTTGGTGWANNILSSIAGNRYQTTEMPDLGITDPTTKNVVNYLNYLFEKANTENDNNYRTAAVALQNQGQAESADVERLRQDNLAQVNQNSISSGLMNTTVPSSLYTGVNRSAANENQRIQENLGKSIVSLLESKSTNAPNAATWASLMQNAALGRTLSNGTSGTGGTTITTTPTNVGVSFNSNGSGFGQAPSWWDETVYRNRSSM